MGDARGLQEILKWCNTCILKIVKLIYFFHLLKKHCKTYKTYDADLEFIKRRAAKCFKVGAKGSHP